MRWDQVVEVLDTLDAAAVPYWVAGGWGVDLLVGVETRDHRDLDLAIDAAHHDGCMAALSGLGFVVETDWLPLRVEVAASDARWVDVHPVSFNTHSIGIQGHPTGTHFIYQPSAFAVGRLAGRNVPCLSRAQQQVFHTGYEPRPQDHHDLDQLKGLDHP